jgi:hypothetical protein
MDQPETNPGSPRRAAAASATLRAIGSERAYSVSVWLDHATTVFAPAPNPGHPDPEVPAALRAATVPTNGLAYLGPLLTPEECKSLLTRLAQWTAVVVAWRSPGRYEAIYELDHQKHRDNAGRRLLSLQTRRKVTAALDQVFAGNDWILEHVSVVSSFPKRSARNVHRTATHHAGQQWHWDMKHIPNMTRVNLMVPLDTYTTEHGFTEVVPNTHQSITGPSEVGDTSSSIICAAGAGCGYVFDQTAIHRGCPNRTSQARHVLLLAARSANAPPDNLNQKRSPVSNVLIAQDA